MKCKYCGKKDIWKICEACRERSLIRARKKRKIKKMMEKKYNRRVK